MTLPSEILPTPADLARYADRYEQVKDRPQVEAARRYFGEDQTRTFFAAGEWLGEQLRALGLPKAECSALCQDHGRRCADDGPASDPWAVAKEILAGVLARVPR